MRGWSASAVLLRRPLVLPAQLIIVLHRGVSGGAKDFRRWPMEDVAVPALMQPVAATIFAVFARNVAIWSAAR